MFKIDDLRIMQSFGVFTPYLISDFIVRNPVQVKAEFLDSIITLVGKIKLNGLGRKIFSDNMK